MTDENPPPLRARRFRPQPGPATTTSFRWSNRLVLRLLGIPIVAVAGVYLYTGVRDRLVLPDCDSSRAKHSLSEILDQLKLSPMRFDPIKTVSSGKEQVVCNATLPLADGGTVDVDYTFYWDGGTAQMRYSVARKAPSAQH